MGKALYEFPDGRKASIEYDTVEQLQATIDELDASITPKGPLSREALGFGAGVASALAPESITAPDPLERQAMVDYRARQMAAAPGFATAGKITGSVAPALFAPSTAGMAIAPRIGSEFAFNAAQSALQDGSFAQGLRAGSVAGGITAALPIVGRAAKAVGRGVDFVRSGSNPQQIADLMRVEQEAGLPGVLTVGELRGSPMLQRTEANLERIPVVGTLKNQERRNQIFADRAVSMRDQYGPVDDVGAEIQASLRRTEDANSKQASALYDQVEQASAGIKAKLKLTATQKAARDAIARLSKNADVRNPPPVVESLKRYAAASPRTFADARALRSDVLSDIRQAEKQQIAGKANDKEVAALNEIQRALEQDISTFADGAGGNVRTLYRKAQDYFRENVAPFKEREIRKAVGAEDTDTLFPQFLKKNRVQLAEKLGGKLDEQGRQALKYGVIDAAYEAATKGAQFNPIAFRNEIQKLGKTRAAVFSPDELKSIEGYMKLAGMARGVGEYAANPKTGVQVLDVGATLGAGAWLAKDPVSGTLTLASLKAMSEMLTNPRARNLLAKIADTKPQTQTMRYLVRELEKLGIRGPAQSAERDEKK
jgi:hypothetical protein